MMWVAKVISLLVMANAWLSASSLQKNFLSMMDLRIAILDNPRSALRANCDRTEKKGYDVFWRSHGEWHKACEDFRQLRVIPPRYYWISLITPLSRSLAASSSRAQPRDPPVIGKGGGILFFR